MKILLFFSTHRQLMELKYSSEFFNRSEFLKNNADVVVYCDNESYTEDLLKEYVSYQTNTKIIMGKQIFAPGTPTGISGNGIHIGLSNCFDMFKEYDYVINMTPDCYITDDKKIIELLNEEFTSDNNFIFDYHPNINPTSAFQFCCDFFVFKPNKIDNFFMEIDFNNLIPPENFIYNKIIERNIKFRTIERIDSIHWNIDNYGLIHNHNLLRIQKILYEGIDDKNLRHC